MFSVRLFNQVFQIVDFVEVEAATGADAITAAETLKGAGWSAEYAVGQVAYVANVYTA